VVCQFESSLTGRRPNEDAVGTRLLKVWTLPPGTVPSLMPLPSVRRMRVMTKHCRVEQRKRAVKMVLDHLDEYR
jgi:hypothetical protein